MRSNADFGDRSRTINDSPCPVSGPTDEVHVFVVPDGFPQQPIREKEFPFQQDCVQARIANGCASDEVGVVDRVDSRMRRQRRPAGKPLASFLKPVGDHSGSIVHAGLAGEKEVCAGCPHRAHCCREMVRYCPKIVVVAERNILALRLADASVAGGGGSGGGAAGDRQVESETGALRRTQRFQLRPFLFARSVIADDALPVLHVLGRDGLEEGGKVSGSVAGCYDNRNVGPGHDRYSEMIAARL